MMHIRESFLILANLRNEFVRSGIRHKVHFLFPSIFILYMTFSLILWHFSLVYIAADVSMADIAGGIRSLLVIYTSISFALAALVFLICYPDSFSRRRKNVMFLSIAALYAFFTFLRMLDWGSVYFGGQHIDSEFWYHAFYADGTSFLLTPESLILIVLIVLAVSVFVLMIRVFERSIRYFRAAAKVHEEKTGGDSALKPATPLATGFLFSIITIAAVMYILPSQSGENISKERKDTFSRLPEYAVVSSFIKYISINEPATIGSLDTAVSSRLRKFGISVNSMGDTFPLMKKSIYFNAKNRSAVKPHLDPDTSIIIVFAESMSGFFLWDEYRDLKILTPNYHDMIGRSYSFSRMYNADYPTLRGMIATLGSGLYRVEKIRGIRADRRVRVPVVSRFLFLSDVLKKRGYTTMHLQGGSGTFVGMRTAFTKRQSYDKFYCRESLDLIKYARYPHNSSHWGIRDQDVFGFAVKLMKEGISQPFLMTLSTLDMHPPYDPLFTHPKAKGSGLLNCLYSADTAFGELWKYFKDSPYARNTVLLVVADHAMGPNSEYIKLLNQYGQPARRMCDFIPCIMYLPQNSAWRGRVNRTICTNLDIAPTLLDMMNVDVPNPFLGLSLFSERPRFPLPVSNYYLPAERELLDGFTAEEKLVLNRIEWTIEDQNTFMDFLNSLALRRKIVSEK